MNSVGPTVPFIGASGASGFAGASGVSGWSGFSGISGYSGFSGNSGYSGFSGVSGRSGYSGFSGISGYSGYSGISGYSGYSGLAPSAPPLPAFDNVVAAYGLNNFNPVGYSGGDAVSVNDAFSKAYLEVAPYPLNWAGVIDGNTPPYLLDVLNDQNSGVNNLIQSGAARPTLQVTTPVIVSGAGTAAANGTYTYRGQFSDRAYYNLVGQPDDFSVSSIKTLGPGWRITDAGGNGLYESVEDVAFPWQVSTWDLVDGANPAPTVAAGTQTGQIDFDGTDDCLATAGSITLGTAATAYLRFKTTDVVSTDVLFEIGAGPLTTAYGVSVRTVAGVLTVSVTDGTGLLLNSKICNVATNTYYIITIIIDTTQGTAANQVKLLVSNSTTGVTSPISTDLASGNLADGVLNVGARNQSSAFFTGSATDLIVYSVAHTPTQATAMFDYINQVLYP